MLSGVGRVSSHGAVKRTHRERRNMKRENGREVPSVTGMAPVTLGGERVAVMTAANMAEFSRLPKAGQRCPVSGASRTWLVETNAKIGAGEKFLVRVRRRGCLRGTVFVSVPKLCAFIAKASAGKVPGFVAEEVAE
jgi:hypothetical protein